MARVLLALDVDGTSVWRNVAGTKEEVAAELERALRDGNWCRWEFEGRETVILNPAFVIWVQD